MQVQERQSRSVERRIRYNVFQTLQVEKDLNNPRKLSDEAERESGSAKMKFYCVHVDHLKRRLDHIPVILPSTNSLTRILLQRQDNILE